MSPACVRTAPRAPRPRTSSVVSQSMRVACGVAIAAIIAVAGAAYEPTAPDEVKALRALYVATGGPEWGHDANFGWLNSTSDPCGVAPYYCGEKCTGWRGVLCWGPYGHVRALNLRSSRLSGSLPTELGLLSHLAYLDVSHTKGIPSRPGAVDPPSELGHLQGTIPSELGLLRFRRTEADGSALIINRQRISGTLPEALAYSLDDVGEVKCQLPSTLGCSLVGVPPVCTFAGKRRGRARRVCAVDRTRRACANDEALYTKSRRVRTPMEGRLCRALAHLGTSNRLPSASLADSLLAAGVASLDRFANESARELQRRLTDLAGAEGTAGSQHLSDRRRHHSQMVGGVHASIKAQLQEEDRWQRLAPLGLRERLEECCEQAPLVGSRVTHGRWPTRKMHPCCAPITSVPVLRRAVARDGDGVRLGALVRKLQRGQALTIVVVGGSISTSEYAGCTRGAESDPLRQTARCKHGRGWARLVVAATVDGRVAAAVG